MAVMSEYLWLVVVGALGAFGFGWGTGANDVANAFGTSVGSKTLTLKQAVIIAAIFEFAGALLLGRVSTNTIAGGIASITAFQREPEIYAYGMCCALGVGTIWLIITSVMGLNVSSTHSIIGGILGFALVYEGANGVTWAVRDPGAFPPYKGVIAIVLTWFIAPILTGLVSAVIFLLVRTLILRRSFAYNASFWLLPVLVLITVFINIFFVFTKGAKKSFSGDDWSDAKAAWISAVIAAGMAIIVAVVVLPILKRFVERGFNAEGESKANLQHGAELSTAKNPAKTLESDLENADKEPRVEEHKPQSWISKAGKLAMHGMNVDIHHRLTRDDRLRELHERAEIFSPRVEYTFKYLQVFSAICVIFAHGAGEVGYMAGPLATIWEIYQTGALQKNVQPPVWIILIGALGLVIGLATYGYNVTRAMGVQLAKLTPTRGFSAELATSFTIMIAAQYGLPTSSSQCITGAVVGVGLCENLKGTGVNWRQFGRQFASWVATLFLVGFCTAALFAQGVYSPSVVSGKQVLTYENRVVNLTTNMYKDFNTTLQSYRNASESGALPALGPQEWKALNASVDKANTAAKKLTDVKYTQSVDASTVMGSLYKVLALYQQNTVFTLGQNTVRNGSQICNSNLTTAIANNSLTACKAPKLLPTAYQTHSLISFPLAAPEVH